MAEDVRIKVTLETQQAERSLKNLKREAEQTADALDDTSTGPTIPQRRPSAQARFARGGSSGLGGALGGGGGGGLGGLAARVGPLALAAGAAIAVNKVAAPAFQALGRPGGSLADAGAGLVQGSVDLVRNIPLAGQAIGAVFDRTVGTALNAREQAIQATAQATSGLAAAGIQVDQQTLSQINAVHMEQAIRGVRNEAAARRAAPGILDSVLGLGLE